MTTDPVSDDTAIRSTGITRRPTANVIFTTEPLPSGARGYRFPAFPVPAPPAHIPSFLDSDDDDPAALSAAEPAARDVPGTGTGRSPTAVEPEPPAAVSAMPTPDTHLPGSPRPASHLPATPASHLPAPPGPTSHLPAPPASTSHPAPSSHASHSPAPVLPAPVGPALEVEDPPSGEAIEAEIAAEVSAQAAQAAPPARRAEAGEWRGIVVVTGTDTGVGKTIVTAAIAAAAQASGLRVAVIKPGQTGMATGESTDIDVINRLAAPDTVRTLAEYPEPMAPLAAARIAELPPLELYEVVDAIRTEADKHDLVLVEGAGGLLVPMGVRPSGEPWTVADLATTLGVGTLVVARAGLGTLNHTALTLEALSRRGVPAGVIIGAWPADPRLVHWANLSELLPHLVGVLPDGAGQMDPGVFRRSAPGWLTPSLYGVLDSWRVWAEDAG